MNRTQRAAMWALIVAIVGTTVIGAGVMVSLVYYASTNLARLLWAASIPCLMIAGACAAAEAYVAMIKRS